MSMFDLIRQSWRRRPGHARWMRAVPLIGSVTLVSGGCLSQQGAESQQDTENVGEVASADTLYTGTCPAGSRFELTVDGRPGCRNNFDVCQDVDVAATGGGSSPWGSSLYASGPGTIGIGEWGAFPSLTQTGIGIDCTACSYSWPPTTCAAEWGYTGNEVRPAVYVGVDKNGQAKTAQFNVSIDLPLPGVAMINSSNCTQYNHGTTTSTAAGMRWCYGADPSLATQQCAAGTTYCPTDGWCRAVCLPPPCANGLAGASCSDPPPREKSGNPTCDPCGKLTDGGNIQRGDGAARVGGMVGNPVNLLTRIKTETHECLKLGDQIGPSVAGSVTWDSGVWEMNEGAPTVGRGWVVGYDLQISVQPGNGSATRILRLNGGGSVEAQFDASAVSGPYYPLGATAASAAVSLIEEKSNTLITGYLLTQQSGGQMHFDPSGNLDWLSDEYANRLTIAWENNGTLKRLANQATGQSLEMVYTQVNGQTRLTQIRDAAANRPATPIRYAPSTCRTTA